MSLEPIEQDRDDDSNCHVRIGIWRASVSTVLENKRAWKLKGIMK